MSEESAAAELPIDSVVVAAYAAFIRAEGFGQPWLSTGRDRLTSHAQVDEALAQGARVVRVGSVMNSPNEERVAYLEGEVEFWRDQQKFAASVCATVTDLDEQAPALRQMLRAEMERRRQAEDEVARLGSRLSLLEGTAT